MKTTQGIPMRRLFTGALLLGALSLAACSREATKPVEKEPAYGGGTSISDPGKVGALQEKWGVKVLGIQTTATGYLLDFRYRVLDATKAAPLLDRHIQPYVIVEKDKARLEVPVTDKLGALRQTTRDVKENRNYLVLFSNPARHVKSGDKVTVVIGDFKVEHLNVI
jgi:hypothetical protein